MFFREEAAPSRSREGGGGMVGVGVGGEYCYKKSFNSNTPYSFEYKKTASVNCLFIKRKPEHEGPMLTDCL